MLSTENEWPLYYSPAENLNALLGASRHLRVFGFFWKLAAIASGPFPNHWSMTASVWTSGSHSFLLHRPPLNIFSWPRSMATAQDLNPYISSGPCDDTVVPQRSVDHRLRTTGLEGISSADTFKICGNGLKAITTNFQEIGLPQNSSRVLSASFM